LVEVLCDTSFLIQLATERITNISNIQTEIGSIEFVVPLVVKNELNSLILNEKKKKKVEKTLELVSKLRIKEIDGKIADHEITEYIKKNGGIVATIDKILKQKIKEVGGSVISLSKNKIILE
jgi:uncharacterized protein